MPDSRTGGAPAAGRQEAGGKSLVQTLIQGVGIFMLTQFVVNQFFGSKTQSTGSAGTNLKQNVNFEDRADVTALTNYSQIPHNIAPLWPDNSVVDIQMYVSPQLTLPSLATLPKENLVLDEKSFRIGNYSENREVNTHIAIPKEVQHNGTLWAHFFVALAGNELDPTSPSYDPYKAEYFRKPLNQYLPKKKARKLKNLLDKSESVVEDDAEESTGPQIASYYHPNFTVAVIPNTGIQNWRQMHPAVRKNIVLEPTGQRDSTGQNGWYYPVIFLNTFWQLRSHMTELNDTVTSMPLNINLYNLANWKYSLLASIDEGMKQNAQQAASGGPMPASGDGSEFEKFKEILLDTNAYLLGTTFVVSILHMVFEGLAFKNDISHWRKKKDNVGTSVRTILANVFMQAVIFLYLVDNSENTSWMILASQGFGIVLEAWKITKTVDVRLREPGPDSSFKGLLPYVIVFEDKHKLSETEKKTQEYDQIAFRYLYIIAVPLLLAYAVYSLIYESHKSWYSFIIETLVGSVYAYGFLMMVPSLYINYRLKSVAHMPSKALTYKFLNTFIDDLFAFTIRMPLLHRLATLRDDVIFFVWLYQKWAYKVDYTRVNEFGQGGDDEDEEHEDNDKKVDGEAKKILAGQDTKELKPSVPVSRASGAQANAGAKKRK
ncbi:hypothetical protein G647_05482 [Cladophialophora carrionii CBS 160.54]|uniref:Cleft lip and palate transmembrane protein 1 n=1 Tax=Cladophialophora carrionii CBS 160.54 TaxID=1279043 RepID=V9D9S4_9EURO|nr:uncharacterized protein G647_05482 [Cladophialophora carrionii CBS 160.54]ETI23679.1 hypothetical protein G647_05482 [Cladophialophora carrionii CBS 160.54]